MKHTIATLLLLLFSLMINACGDSSNSNEPATNTSLEEAATIFAPVTELSKVLSFVETKSTSGDLSPEVEAQLNNCTLSETSNSTDTLVDESTSIDGADCPLSYSLNTSGSQSASQANLAVDVNYSTSNAELIAATDLRSVNCSITASGTGNGSTSMNISASGQCFILSESQGAINIAINISIQVSNGDSINISGSATASVAGKVAQLTFTMNSSPAGTSSQILLNGQDVSNELDVDGIVSGI